MLHRSKFLNKNATGRRSLKMTNFFWNVTDWGHRYLKIYVYDSLRNTLRVRELRVLYFTWEIVCRAVFFFAWNAICNAWKFLEFFPWKSSTHVKKPKKTFKNTRENHVLLVKFSANHARESKIYRRGKYRILHLWKGK